MQTACSHHDCMPALIQIRNVPTNVHRALKARAAALGVSLSELALEALTRSLERPTRAEFMATLETRTKTPSLTTSPADILREARNAR